MTRHRGSRSRSGASLPKITRPHRAAAHQEGWRNVLFAKRERAKLRRPPSVLLSKYVADHANRTATLSQEVEHQARQLLLRLETERPPAG